jgi:RND family efflux transporter MFP subunit
MIAQTQQKKSVLRIGVHAVVVLFFLLVVLIVFSILQGCGQTRVATSADTQTIPVVDVAPVQRGPIAHSLEAPAEFRPYQEIDVHAKIAGYVKKIYVDIGDHVRTGQLLAVLEIPELQDEVTQASAEVKRAEQEIIRAQADLRRAESVYEVAHLSSTRLAEVMKTRPDLVAQQEMDEITGKDKQAEAQVDTDRAALGAAQQQLSVARANLSKTQALFAYAEIRAPFAGIITKRYADTGAMLAAGTTSEKQAIPLVRLSQNGLLRLTIPVPEASVPFVHIGSVAKIHVSGLNRDFSGKVIRFSSEVVMETRTMDTEIDVLNPRFELVPGMYADVSIVLDARPDALTIPVQGLDRVGGNATAFVVNSEGKIEERQVSTGIETATRIEVLSGLREGELVVLGNHGSLRAGEKVQVKQSEPANPQGGR